MLPVIANVVRLILLIGAGLGEAGNDSVHFVTIQDELGILQWAKTTRPIEGVDGLTPGDLGDDEAIHARGPQLDSGFRVTITAATMQMGPAIHHHDQSI